MKTLIKIFLFASIVFGSFYSVTAEIGSIDSISIDNVSDNSSDISWPSVSGAFGYYIYYSETPRDNNGYDNPIVEFVETSDYSIVGLKKTTTYYVSIRVVDEDVNEGDFSDEISFSTKSSSIKKSNFGLTNLKVEELNKLILVFSLALDDGINSVREFKIVQKNDNSKFTYVESSEIQNSNELVLNLDSQLLIGEEYNLSVISIRSKTGENIQSGIDGLFSFTIPNSFIPVVPEIVENPSCDRITLSQLNGNTPFNTNVTCEGTDVSSFRIECGNGSLINNISNGLTTFSSECSYPLAGTYNISCYINDKITSDSCLKSIDVYSAVDVEINTNNNNKNSNIEGSNDLKNTNNDKDDTNINQGGSIGGQNINLSSSKNTDIEIISDNQAKLPKTGPENIIIFIVSLLFGIFIMFSFKSRRS